MEIANIMVNGDVKDSRYRIATRADAGEIMRLLQTAVYRHIHIDWYVPGDWLGSSGFVVKNDPTKIRSRNQFVKLMGAKQPIEACLAIAPDPKPIAWVRLAGLKNQELAFDDLKKMLQIATTAMKKDGVNAIAWLAVEEWPNEWLPRLGFKQINHIQTYVKEDSKYPEPTAVAGLDIRPMLDKDLDQLAHLEAKAFNHLWRHSGKGLGLAKNQSFSFDVALMEEQVVGFQLSTPNDYGVHLVRMTVDPAWQQKGIGSVLLAHSIRGYHRRDRYRITLNTQVDNLPSQKLYLKFGFRPNGQKFPVWALKI